MNLASEIWFNQLFQAQYEELTQKAAKLESENETLRRVWHPSSLFCSDEVAQEQFFLLVC